VGQLPGTAGLLGRHTYLPPGQSLTSEPGYPTQSHHPEVEQLPGTPGLSGGHTYPP
ncbi:hypothetical protein NDU88_007212, partial [Pleurodeles waltl]